MLRLLLSILLALPLAAEGPKCPKVRVTTSMGEFELELRLDAAPKTVENFMKRVGDGFYTWLGSDGDTGEPKLALVSDTVGFIRKLPHQLVAAFRSTLGEVRTSDALLIVTDAAHPDLDEHLRIVGATLREIGCQDHPRLVVLNQSDRLTRPRRLDLKRRLPGAAIVSALEKTGLDDIRAWLLDLAPGPPAPRELEWWETPN